MNIFIISFLSMSISSVHNTVPLRSETAMERERVLLWRKRKRKCLIYGFPRKLLCVQGLLFSSVVEHGISSDMTRYRTVTENVTDSRYFSEFK